MQSYEALSGSTRLYDTTHKLDSVGRIVEKTETIEGQSTTYAYAYDEEGNLKEVKKDGGVVASYVYDENGNRLGRTTPSGTTEGSYDAQDRLTSYGTNGYSYTPDGQLKTKTDTSTGNVTSYDYDAMGNLLSVSLPEGKQVEYAVDARNRRVGKKVDGQLVQGFLYLGKLAPVAELDGSGNIVSRFVYATHKNVPDYMEKGSKTYRIITDQVGSVRLVVDASTGEVAQRIDYDEFGNVLEDTNPGFQPFGFAGGLYDPDTKFTRFGARDYDAQTGRWTAKDPINFAGGQANLYAYVGNDPVNLIDPTGLCEKPERPWYQVGNSPGEASLVSLGFLWTASTRAATLTSTIAGGFPGGTQIGGLGAFGATPGILTTGGAGLLTGGFGLSAAHGRESGTGATKAPASDSRGHSRRRRRIGKRPISWTSGSSRQ